MQDSNATAVRDAAAAGVCVVPAGDGDRQERHGADRAADLTAELIGYLNSRI